MLNEPPTPIERNSEQKQPLVKMNIKTSRRFAFSPYWEIGGGLKK